MVNRNYTVLPTDENSAIEIRPSDIPKSMREDEVDQSEEEETVEHLDDDEKGGTSGRVKIIADATNETDSESLKKIRLKNERLGDDASTDFSEISEDEDQTGITIRSLRTAHSDDWLSDEKAEEIIHKVRKVINMTRLPPKKERKQMHLESSKK